MEIIRPIKITDSGSFVRASTGTYVDKNGATQTAAANVPRFTYDATNLTKPPVLVTADANISTLKMLSLLPEADAPVIDMTKCYVIGDRVMSNHRVYESAVGRTSNVTVNSGTVTWVNHGLVSTQGFRFTSGTAPNGMALNTTYYVLSVTGTHTFTFSTSINGPTNTSTSVGAVAHTVENLNMSPALYPSVWLDTGPTNKWAIVDESVESQTVAADAVCFAVKVATDELVDSVVVQNIENGKFARVVMIDPIDGIVYDNTIALISDSGINDPYAYTYEPLVYDDTFMVSDLPRYTGATISVAISNTGATVKAGLCIVGASRKIGATQAGVQTGIQDYSVKEVDEFGNSTVKQRSFASTMNATVWVDSTQRKAVIRLLNGYRATPIMYIGDRNDSTTWLYGYFRDYSNGIDMPTVSVLNIEIESLK